MDQLETLQELLSTLHRKKAEYEAVTHSLQNKKDILIHRCKEHSICQIKVNDESTNEIVSTIGIKKRSKSKIVLHAKNADSTFQMQT